MVELEIVGEIHDMMSEKGDGQGSLEADEEDYGDVRV